MQRATYLAQLYESVASIPPDIQQCLLTIAQYGCDADQVRRWYNLVRSHFGVGEVESPTALEHQTPKSISRARTQNQATKAEPPVTPNVQYQDAGSTWSTPAVGVSNESQSGSGLSNFDSQQRIENLFQPSTPLPQSVVFTGHGLIPAQESVPSGGFHSDFLSKSPAMPLLSPFDKTFDTMAVRLSPRPKTVAPSSVLCSSPEQKVKPARKRRKLAQKPVLNESGSVMEPPPRPRRPSVPFRSNEQPAQPLRVADIFDFDAKPGQMGKSSSGQYRSLPQVPIQESHSPFEDLYIPGQLHQPSSDFNSVSVRLTRPEGGERRPSCGQTFEGLSGAPPLYESPYRDAEHVVSSC